MALPSKVTSNQWQRYARVGATAATPRIVGLSLQKETKSGTSHFWLTAPGPIVVFSLTPGDLEGVVEQFSEKKPIYLKEREWAPAEDGSFSQEDAVTLRDEIIADFFHACTIARTVVLDKESHMWDLFRYAEFGSPKGDVPRDFDKVNCLYKKFIMRPKSCAINFGMVQLMKEEWGSATKKTGGLKAWGFGECSRIAHTILEHERSGDPGHFNTVVRGTRGPGMRQVTDQLYQDLDVPTLGQLLFPDTDEPDWV
jgi:hypothetical protein